MHIYSRLLLYPALTVILSGCSAHKEHSEDKLSAYLMVFHQDADHGLHMAVSHDGYTFVALNGGLPVMAGDTIAEQKGIRDPHIYRGPDGAFYLAMTDLHIFAREEGKRDTEWERDGELYGWGNNRGLVLMKSDDLINWKRTNLRIDAVSQELSEIGCAWAPETIYDPEAEKLMVYYTMRIGNGQNKLYYFYVNDDYDKMESLPELLFEYPDGVTTAIDGDITQYGDKYHLMYVAHDGTPGIKQAVADSPSGPWTYIDEWVDTEKGACEAPNIWMRNDGSGRWVLMYDVYSVNPHNFGFLETSDFETFTDLGRFNDGVMKTVGFESPKHGAVVSITEDEARRLIERWGIAE